jgi:hypothetical protein
MKSDTSIDNDTFKNGDTDFKLIAAYLALNEAKGEEIARLAAQMAPKTSVKFDSSGLVHQAIRLDATVRGHMESERASLIAEMNLGTLLHLHKRLHGKGDKDFLAERDQKRLCDPLAAPLVQRMRDVAEVRDMIREQKRIAETEWQSKFAKAAKGNNSISLQVALQIVFPRAENRVTYYEEFCKLNGDYGSRTFPLRPIPPLTSASFVELAMKLKAAYQDNKDAWIKMAQRTGGRKGGKKSAALRELAANHEAARSLDAMPGKVIKHDNRGNS